MMRAKKKKKLSPHVYPLGLMFILSKFKKQISKQTTHTDRPQISIPYIKEEQGGFPLPVWDR